VPVLKYSISISELIIALVYFLLHPVGKTWFCIRVGFSKGDASCQETDNYSAVVH